MKRILLAALLIATLSACTSRTEYGECVGITDEKKPDLQYKVSERNLIVGILFFELIAPPVLVLTNEFQCPVGKK